MNGGWTSDTLIYSPTGGMQTGSSDSNLTIFWQPHGCNIESFQPNEVQTALKGQTIQFIGDSTMVHLVSSFIQLVWPEIGMVDVTRDFDSQLYFTNISTRVVFKFIGARDYNANADGLPAFVQDPLGKISFLNRTARDADYVVMGAGPHEVAGGRAIQEIQSAMPVVFQWVVDNFPKIAVDSRRLVWRTALPLITPIRNMYWPSGSCAKNSSSVLSWMNFISSQNAESFDTSFMDAHRVCLSEMFILKFLGSPSCTADGIHFQDCMCNEVQARALIHFLMIQQHRSSSAPDKIDSP